MCLIRHPYVSSDTVANGDGNKSLEEQVEDLSLNESLPEEVHYRVTNLNRIPAATARDIVLRKCNQTDPIQFKKCYPNT